MMDTLEDYYGRQFLEFQIEESVQKFSKQRPSMITRKGQLFCGRCQSLIDSRWMLPDKSYYCRRCIVFGRITSDSRLYSLPQHPFPKENYLRWQGQLTPHQDKVSKQLLSTFLSNEDVWIHAVTGAGKTEITYATIAKALSKGYAVAIVSPRVDVCRELYSRFKRDFSCEISLLHQRSKPYKRSPLVIATIHQLFKFHRAFDLIIIDEVDAYPYSGNPMLEAAVDLALKKSGRQIFLTATSTKQLNRRVKRAQLKKLELPKRYHDSAMVVPKMIWIGRLTSLLSPKQIKLPKKLLHDIELQRQTGYPLLIFYPTIEGGRYFSEKIGAYFKNETVAFVSSESEERLSTVERFRTGEVNILVSTTVLERGVTFPKVDVFVVEASHKLYTASALIQMSGRVGRSKERPEGLLNFYHSGKTKAMVQAIKEIKQMNKKAGK